VLRLLTSIPRALVAGVVADCAFPSLAVVAVAAGAQAKKLLQRTEHAACRGASGARGSRRGVRSTPRAGHRGPCAHRLSGRTLLTTSPGLAANADWPRSGRRAAAQPEAWLALVNGRYPQQQINGGCMAGEMTRLWCG